MKKPIMGHSYEIVKVPAELVGQRSALARKCGPEGFLVAFGFDK